MNNPVLPFSTSLSRCNYKRYCITQVDQCIKRVFGVKWPPSDEIDFLGAMVKLRDTSHLIVSVVEEDTLDEDPIVYTALVLLLQGCLQGVSRV